MKTTNTTDPRVQELIDLATAEGRPLALDPAQITRLEDQGWIVDPFTGALLPQPRFWPTPAACAGERIPGQ